MPTRRPSRSPFPLRVLPRQNQSRGAVRQALWKGAAAAPLPCDNEAPTPWFHGYRIPVNRCSHASRDQIQPWQSEPPANCKLLLTWNTGLHKNSAGRKIYPAHLTPLCNHCKHRAWFSLWKSCPSERHRYSTSPGSSQPTVELKTDFAVIRPVGNKHKEKETVHIGYQPNYLQKEEIRW